MTGDHAVAVRRAHDSLEHARLLARLLVAPEPVATARARACAGDAEGIVETDLARGLVVLGDDGYLQLDERRRSEALQRIGAALDMLTSG